MQGSCFTRFCRSELTPHIDLTLVFVLSLAPASSLLPHRQRPVLAELPAVQLQRDPKCPESGGRPDVPCDLRPLWRVDPVEAVPQDHLQDPVPGRGRP